MSMNKELTPSMEDYLEAILHLEKLHRVARVKDIANFLGVQMPSVTGALKNLRQRGLINYEKNSFISLTEEGLEVANAVQEKHSILECFLTKTLQLPIKEAQDQACRIEHVVSGETTRRIKNLISYIEDELIKNGTLSEEKWEKVLTRKQP